MNVSKSKFDPGPAPASQTREYSHPVGCARIRLVDANTFDALLKRDGKVVQTARNAVSADGTVMTVTVNGSDAVTGRKFTTIIVLEKKQ